MLGIRFSETMTGSVKSPTGGERPFGFTVTATGRRALLAPFGSPFELEGTVTLGGDDAAAVERAPVHGTLVVDYVRARRYVYDLFWVDTSGRPHRFHGRKDLHLRDPVESVTVLRGTVYSQSESLGDAKLTFDLADLPAMLMTFRPTFAR